MPTISIENSALLHIEQVTDAAQGRVSWTNGLPIVHHSALSRAIRPVFVPILPAQAEFSEPLRTVFPIHGLPLEVGNTQN